MNNVVTGLGSRLRTPTKLRKNHQADSVGERAEILGPTKLFRNEGGGHKDPSKEHLRNKEKWEHLSSELWIFHAASEHDGHRCTGRGESVGDEVEVEVEEIHLEVDHKVSNDSEAEDLSQGHQSLHRQSRSKIGQDTVMVGGVFAKENWTFGGELHEGVQGGSKHAHHQANDERPKATLDI